MRLSRRWVIGTATIAGLLVMWAVLTMVTGTIDTPRFPSPVQFWQSAKQIMTTGYADGTLLSHALHSLKLVAMGFCGRYCCGHPARAPDGLEPPGGVRCQTEGDGYKGRLGAPAAHRLPASGQSLVDGGSWRRHRA